MRGFFIGLPRGANRRKATQRRGTRLVLQGILVGLVAVGLRYLPDEYATGPESTKLTEMQDELTRVRKESDALVQDVAARRRVVEALKSDPHAVEDVARAELFMVYPHEVTFRLVERQGAL